LACTLTNSVVSGPLDFGLQALVAEPMPEPLHPKPRPACETGEEHPNYYVRVGGNAVPFMSPANELSAFTQPRTAAGPWRGSCQIPDGVTWKP
jgi:hypothetical protein